MSIHTDDFALPPGAPGPRLVSAAPASPREEALERALRPKLLDEYVGQAKAREQLEIFIGAAKKRGAALDHVLLFGPPGLGKTTLSHIIAHELGVQLRQTSGPVLEKPKDLAAILTSLERNDVLFIDEIHRLSPVVEEILYPALEDYQIDILIGEGPAARSIKLDVQPFTLVGATTLAGMLTNPLRDRFGIVARLEFNTPEELARIVTRSAGLLDVPTDAGGAAEIARRSRGTPRIANRLLRRVRDWAQVKGNGRIDAATAAAAGRQGRWWSGPRLAALGVVGFEALEVAQFTRRHAVLAPRPPRPRPGVPRARAAGHIERAAARALRYEPAMPRPAARRSPAP